MRVPTLAATVLLSLVPMAAMAQDPAPPQTSPREEGLAKLHSGLEALASNYRGSAPAPEPLPVPVLEATPQNLAMAALLADIASGGTVYRRH